MEAVEIATILVVANFVSTASFLAHLLMPCQDTKTNKTCLYLLCLVSEAVLVPIIEADSSSLSLILSRFKCFAPQ